MKETEIVYFREGFFQSVVADLFTFGIIVSSIWFNEAFVGGSNFLNGVLLVMFVLFLISKIKNRKQDFTSFEQLFGYLLATLTDEEIERISKYNSEKLISKWQNSYEKEKGKNGIQGRIDGS